MHPARLPPRASGTPPGLVQAIILVGQFMIVLDGFVVNVAHSE
jgi:hypothetical protein